VSYTPKETAFLSAWASTHPEGRLLIIDDLGRYVVPQAICWEADGEIFSVPENGPWTLTETKVHVLKRDDK
jgi:hypothetical protein